ncbi:MAG: Rne/Rng family ribonuclease [Pseudomonadota bacterium]|nr:Rne/Rng family ribonuclease [Pseudomonadota bacterium]
MTNKLMCINATQPTEPRVAIIEGQRLKSLETQENDMNRSCGNIYLGTITSIQPGIDAVFVDFGSQRHGFLPFKEIAPKYLSGEPSDDSKISDLISTGQTVLVQVNREEKSNKGAALTTFLSLAGAYLVIMPNNHKNNGISKKADAQERAKLKEVLAQLKIPDELSVIVRTEGINRGKDELGWDLECLIHHWNKVHAAADDVKAPALIHQEADTLIRSVRDRLRKNIDSIVVDHKETYDKLRIYLGLTRPEFVEKLSLYQNKVPLFSHFGVQEQINSLFMRKISLPSGGSIVLDYTEAMTVIDVNSSKSTGGKSIEETALKTNIEAAREILSQLSLRDIGGIIVVDFIDMAVSESRQKVESIVENYINTERAKIRYEAISPLTGCMYLSRQRTGPSIIDQHYVECKHCQGLGFHRSILSIANSILYKAEDSSINDKENTITIQASPNVACFLLNEKRAHIQQIESLYGNSVVIISNEQYNDTKYTIKRSTKGSTNPSYEQKELSEPLTKLAQYQSQSQPVVPQNLYKEHPKQSSSAIQRFMNIILPTPKETEPKVYKSTPKNVKQKSEPRRVKESTANPKRPRRRNRSANQTRRTQQSSSTRSLNRSNQSRPKSSSAQSVPADRLDD